MKVFVNTNLLMTIVWKKHPHIYPNDMNEISDKENVFDFYKGNLSFDGKRYKVKLPLKTNHESLPDNSIIAKSRLVDFRDN